MANRETKLTIILGYNGTGKTTITKKIVLNELKHQRRALIITPDDIEWPQIEYVHPKFPHRIRDYVGARKIIYQDGLLPIIADNFRNGLLVFDDCRAYFKASLDSDLHELLIRRRQKMYDIIAVGHGFTEVPPKFFTFASEIILFRTKDNIHKRKDVLINFDEMQEAQRRINNKAQQNPHYFEVIPLR
jgi:ABC-type sugar transport system ATPase subunit